MRARIHQLIGLTLLALALFIGLLALAGGIRDRGKNDTISVTGSARHPIVSDYIVWDASVQSQQATPAAALAQLDRWTGQIRAFLTQSGAQEGEVVFQPIFTETITGQNADGSQSGQIVGYRLTRSFEVRSARVREISALVEASSKLLSQGIPINAQSPQYIFTKLPSLRPQLLAEATRDALKQAEILVQSTGAKLGKLRAVNVGVFQVTAPNSTDVSDYGIYDTSTLKKDVTVVVNVTFALG